jgi:hypothetical protein
MEGTEHILVTWPFSVGSEIPRGQLWAYVRLSALHRQL